MNRRHFLVTGGAGFLGATAPLHGQSTRAPAGALPAPRSDLLTRAWPARWIAPPGAVLTAFGVFHFRKAAELDRVPERYLVHVTADNRYELFVNGERVAWGPARGDLDHWRYETVDITPWLRAGRNVLAAVIWNYADLAPMAQVTHQTGFLLCGDSPAESAFNTDASWKCWRNEAVTPIPFGSSQVRGYFVVGPGERIDGARYPWGWEQPGFDDSGWLPAQAGTPGYPRGARDSPSRWMLVPRDIPPMEEKRERLERTRIAQGAMVPDQWPLQKGEVRVPPHTRADLLLDQNRLTTAFPELVLSGGRGAKVQLAYAESLFEKGKRDKGNRNEVDGKEFIGFWDEFVADGGERRLYRPLWWRTFRYLRLIVETDAEELRILDLEAVAVAFPFERKALFDAGPRFEKLLDTGWRTARLCAHETYVDCPYYEQLQYIGDTRIQALVSYYMAGDARLARSAIAQMDDSRRADGLTMSRYPTRLPQYIPGFSLWWIGMVHDYWMFVPDPQFVKERLPGIRAILDAFAAWQRVDGSLGRVPWWRFFDWTADWKGGDPPMDEDGGSALFDLSLVLALGWAAELESALGLKSLASEYRTRQERLKQTIYKLYWDAPRRMYADTRARRQFSQHTNALAVLAGLGKRELVEMLLEDQGLTQASYYFRYYVHEAMRVTGVGDRYLAQLAPWDQMLAIGLTTWAERPDRPGEPSRSDCHAWSASPNIFLFRTVLGVEPDEPGFASVRLRPALGRLDRVTATVPHPRGLIRLDYIAKGANLTAAVELPPGVTGTIEWRGNYDKLNPGRNRSRL